MAPLAVIRALVLGCQGSDLDHIVGPVVTVAVKRIGREIGLGGVRHHGARDEQSDEPNTVLWHGRPLLAS